MSSLAFRARSHTLIIISVQTALGCIWKKDTPVSVGHVCCACCFSVWVHAFCEIGGAFPFFALHLAVSKISLVFEM